MFDSVIVVTYRTILDAQLQDIIYQLKQNIEEKDDTLDAQKAKIKFNL